MPRAKKNAADVSSQVYRFKITLLDGRHSAEPGAKYPRCVEGARACPPEDCGGPWGYANFLEAIRDPKHEDHDDLQEWIGGKFDSEAFDPWKISKYRRRGLPNWRDDR
jgi:hypothetical protein